MRQSANAVETHFPPRVWDLRPLSPPFFRGLRTKPMLSRKASKRSTSVQLWRFSINFVLISFTSSLLLNRTRRYAIKHFLLRIILRRRLSLVFNSVMGSVPLLTRKKGSLVFVTESLNTPCGGRYAVFLDYFLRSSKVTTANYSFFQTYRSLNFNFPTQWTQQKRLFTTIKDILLVRTRPKLFF